MFNIERIGSSRSTRIKLAVYAIGLVLPVLGMMNCSGWSSANMSVSSCAVGFGLAEVYANLYYNLIFISGFALLVPLVVYVFLVFKLAGFLGKSDGEPLRDKVKKLFKIVLIIVGVTLLSFILGSFGI